MAVMVSCSDQLELYPETNLTEGNYYNRRIVVGG